MSLLDLPLELLHEILGWSIQVRGIKRGLQLQLVNKLFTSEVLKALPMFKLLDSYFELVPNCKDDASKRSAATAYLQHRVLNEGHGGPPILLHVRSVAFQLSRESDDGRNEFDYIRELCPLTFETSLAAPYHPYFSIDLESDVYIAALYTKTLPVIARRLSSGKQLALNSKIFGNARRHAARYGKHEVLAAMMDSCHDLQVLRFRFLSAVAECGRVDATSFVYDFQATQRPWVFSRRLSSPTYPYSNELTLVRLDTPSREIYDFIVEKRNKCCSPKTYSVRDHTRCLIRCAENGWLEMATHYLALGADVEGFTYSVKEGVIRPLILACKNGHEDMVELLLASSPDTGQAIETAVKYGHLSIASLLLHRGAEAGDALGEAVRRGYRSFARAILERTADAAQGLEELIKRAVEIEDEQLVHLLELYRQPVQDN